MMRAKQRGFLLNPFRFGGGGGGGNAYRDEVLADSPLIYLRLGETTGTTAADSSGNGRNGSYVTGFTLNQSPLITVDRSLLLNGSSGYAEAPISGLNLSRDFTLEGWVKTQSGGGTNQAIMSVGLGGYYFRLGDSGTRLQFVQSRTALIGQGPADIAVGDVIHAVLTVNGSGDWVIYKNAVSAASGTTGASFTSSSPVLLFGADFDLSVTSEFLKGFIDEVAVYGSALSAGRVLAHYNAGI